MPSHSGWRSHICRLTQTLTGEIMHGLWAEFLRSPHGTCPRKKRVEEKRLVIREEECRQWLWKRRGESSSAGRAPHHLQGSVERSGVLLEDPYDWVDERVLLRWRGGVSLPAVRKIISHNCLPTHTRVFQNMKGCWFRDGGVKSSRATGIFLKD